MVGFAKTATIRARDPVSGPSYMQKRLDYLDYVAAAPRPSIVVIQDKDDLPGYQKLVARYCGRPLAEYAVAPPEIALG